MSLLLPLGLLGLLGLLVLLLIYIIKPNYQQKLVSSTFVWKLSLKYKKKRIPVSKLRNLLILLCQIIIIVLLALILTQPAVFDKGTIRDNEKIVIIDASASMLATSIYENEKYTRFDEAVDEVIDLAETTFNKGGTLTVIIAGEKSEILSIDTATDISGDTPNVADGDGEADKQQFFRVGSATRKDVIDRLNGIKSTRDDKGNPTYCTYGSADIEGAMALAETVTTVNPKAEVLLYTGKKYLNPNGVTVVDMSRGAEEVNVAILDVRSVMDEGYYTFYADVVSYGENSEVDIEFDINITTYGDAAYTDSVRETFHRNLREGEVTTIVFDTHSDKHPDGSKRDTSEYVYEYKSATVSVNLNDSIDDDNNVTLYGGVKPTLHVQYASTKPNIFFSSALMTIVDSFRNKWDIDVDEVRGTGATPQMSGYDLYIFEHRMPSELPKDGVVILVNPTALPSELGVMLGNAVSGQEMNLIAPEAHPLINYMNVANLRLTNYTPINTYPEGFTTVMQCDGAPVLISKNTADEKIAVMTFSINYSDIAVKLEFPTLVYNIFEYFIPSTFSQYIFDVNDDVTFNARGSLLELKIGKITEQLTQFPAEYHLTQVGSYVASQSLFGIGGAITENFFVKIPAEESNIFLESDLMPGSVVKAIPPTTFDDLLVYFAAALVALLLVEWWLQSRSRI